LEQTGIASHDSHATLGKQQCGANPLTDRAPIGGRRRPADDLLCRRGELLAARGQGLTIPINGIYNGWRMEDA
jgi:hypothetical protein